MSVRVLLIGCGDLGHFIADLLISQSFEVIALRRSGKLVDRVKVIQGDVTIPSTLKSLSSLLPEYVIYCVSADERTDAAYEVQYVTGLQHVIQTQKQNLNLKGFFFVSSTRVYGQDTNEIIDHNAIAQPSDFGGERLLEAEQQLNTLSCPTTTLRLSGLYGPGRLRMINLAKKAPWPEVDTWTNRIHRDDAARFVVHLINMLEERHDLKSHYIVTDDHPVTQFEVLTWIAQQLKLPIPDKQPAVEQGKRLSNQGMRDTGFELLYPSYRDGYAELISTEGMNVNA